MAVKEVSADIAKTEIQLNLSTLKDDTSVEHNVGDPTESKKIMNTYIQNSL
jgi:hypothetical protein